MCLCSPLVFKCPNNPFLHLFKFYLDGRICSEKLFELFVHVLQSTPLRRWRMRQWTYRWSCRSFQVQCFLCLPSKSLPVDWPCELSQNWSHQQANETGCQVQSHPWNVFNRMPWSNVALIVSSIKCFLIFVFCSCFFPTKYFMCLPQMPVEEVEWWCSVERGGQNQAIIQVGSYQDINILVVASRLEGIHRGHGHEGFIGIGLVLIGLNVDPYHWCQPNQTIKAVTLKNSKF